MSTVSTVSTAGSVAPAVSATDRGAALAGSGGIGVGPGERPYLLPSRLNVRACAGSGLLDGEGVDDAIARDVETVELPRRSVPTKIEDRNPFILGPSQVTVPGCGGGVLAQRGVCVPDLVGAGEIAARWGFKWIQRVHDWLQARSRVPKPVRWVGGVGVFPIWPEAGEWARPRYPDQLEAWHYSLGEEDGPASGRPGPGPSAELITSTQGG